ncbi:MAG: hypothetical protein KDJ97_12910 [Anaerolineae bacterium]|nr:hypothetical protein [Anaerolineae bacterium]
MTYKRLLFFSFIFMLALAFALALEDTSVVDAKGLAKPVFDSPIKKKDNNDGPPPANEKGEVDPENLNSNTPVRDPETPGFFIIFLDGTIDEAVQVKLFSTGIPQKVPLLPHTLQIPSSLVPTSGNSPYFFFAVWRRAVEGGAVTKFGQPILINAPYQDLGLSGDQENRIRLWMYNPASQSWIKLGGQVDTFNNVVTGMVTSMTPWSENGNTLFALAFDDSPALTQDVDAFGTTTLASPLRDDFKLRVPAGSVEVGSHFEISPFPANPDSEPFELLGEPIHIDVYRINYSALSPEEKYHMASLSRPVTIEFDPSEYLNQAGDSSTLTIVTLIDGKWVDVEELGYKVNRSEDSITVETTTLGIFALTTK